MRRLAVAAALCLVLAACSAEGSPQAELQTRLNDLVSAANAGDAAAVRTAGGRLLEEIQKQSANADIPSTKAQRMRELTTRVMSNAGLLEPADEPSPSPTRSEPSPEPSPSPTQAEEPSPEVLPSVVLTSEPEPSPT